MSGRKIQGEIEMIPGKPPDHAGGDVEHAVLDGPDVIAARGLKSKVRDFGRVWDLSGKSGEICAIDWSGRTEAMITPEYCQTMARYNAWQNHWMFQAVTGWMTPTRGGPGLFWGRSAPR
jgi:hypothetical protein